MIACKSCRNRQEKQIESKQGRSLGLAMLAMTAVSLLVQLATAEVVLSVDKSTQKSNDASTASEGLLLGATPLYVNFTGQNGLELEVSRPRTTLYDYTLMFWFRSILSYEELLTNKDIENNKAYLFKLENSVGCYITRDVADGTSSGPFMRCDTANKDEDTKDIEINLFDLPDIESWMHITYSAVYNPASQSSGIVSKSYLRIDISTYQNTWEGGYQPIRSGKVYYGCGGPTVDDLGFIGNYRQFYLSVGYIEPQNVPYLLHEYKVLDYSTMAYYKFDQTIFIGRYEDSFRVQKAKPVSALPDFIQENIAAPFCNSIPAKQVDVPQFYRAGGNKFSGLRIPRFKFKERYIGYTMSFWMKNFGQHAFEPNPARGREANHILTLDECFALWYDSKTSFRVYVYAKNNFFETYSDPIFLPLNEWINIQVTLSQQSGITIMTFNQNGERQQLVQNKLFLAEQYPRGTISFFQSFIGIPYKFYLWEQFIELPVTMEDPQYEETLLVAYDFTDYQDGTTETGFIGWPTLVADNGEDFPATKGDGFDFVIDNVPSEADFKDPKLYGQLQAKVTDWDVTCPAPKSSLMYLGGEGVKFDISVLVGKTDTYTIEFWFKADVKNFETKTQDRTFLFMMNGRNEGISEAQLQFYTTNVMAIYVENEELKCAPFGFVDGQPKDPDSILTYKGVNPLKVYEWQHISCVYLRQKYIKGQYLALSLDKEGADLSKSDFRDKTLRPQTFSKNIFKSVGKEILITNQQSPTRWNVILANDQNQSKFFFGSFKDVRIWKSTRTDAQLYSFRFNQAQLQDELEGNIKFMDGSFDIYNDADTNTSGPRYPKREPEMKLEPTDLSNIICATDTYFNPEIQKCTRYPYTEDPSIVYLVVNNVQHGHQMIIERMLDSTMKLPGPKFQPKIKTKWSVGDEAVQNKYFQDRSRDSYELDPIYMGDYKKYRFQVDMNDQTNHNFFLFMNQTVVPRKCLQVVDSATREYKVQSRVLLNDTTADLDFNFQVQRIEGCADEYINKLERELKIETQPPVPRDIVAKILETTQFDRPNESFKVTLTQAVMTEPTMPKNIPINIIFFLFWTSAPLQDEVSYMNVVYTMTLASEINVKMSYKDKVIDVSAGEDLEISAICSSFYNKVNEDCTNEDSSAGLSFKWECATEGDFISNDIQDYCQQWKGSPKIVIPSSKIIDNSGINRPIRIKVVVSAIEASEQDGQAAADLQFSSSEDFTWVNTRKPEFTIEFPKKPDTVLVTKDQEIKIIPKGWKPQDGFSIKFEIFDQDQTKILLETNDNEKQLTFIRIPANTLEQDQRYQCQVTVERDTDGDSELFLKVTELEPFRTGTLPSRPLLTVNPDSGTMYATEFSVELQGAKGEQLEYQVLGVLKDQSEIRLTDDFRSLQEFPSLQRQFPQLERIKVEVRNDFGEVIYVESEVTITKQEGIEWIKIFQSQTGSADQVWQQYQFIASDANADAKAISESAPATPEGDLARKKAEIDARSVNSALAKNSFEEVRQMEQKTVDEMNEKKINYILGGIAKISEYSQFLEPIVLPGQTPQDTIEIIQFCVETLEYVLRIENLMNKINKDPVKRETFVKALGQLMQVTATRAQVQKALLKYTKKDEPKLEWVKTKQDEESDAPAEEPPAEEETAEGEEEEAPAEEEVTADARLLDSWNGEPYSSEELHRRILQDEDVLGVQPLTVSQYNEELLLLYRELLMKVIVIKNDHLDQLCHLEEAINQVTIKTDALQQTVRTFGADANMAATTVFSYVKSESETDIQATLPTEIFRNAMKAKNGGEFNWMCVQVSFMQPNPAAGFEPSDAKQFFFKNQRIMQMGVIDDKGNRMLDEDNSQNGLQDASLVVKYRQRLNVEKFFFRGQTFCGNYNGNEENENQFWTDKKFDADGLDCTHAYDGLLTPDELGTITCTCSYITNFYYTMLTDLTRERIIPRVYQNETHTILYAIQIPLILIGIIFPCIMIFLDAKDYQNVEDNVYPVDDLTIAKLERARNKLCKQEIYYNEKEISRYLKLEENDFRSGSCIAFMAFHRTLHPYFSLATRFDYRLKRLTRFALVLGQVSMITIFLWITYSYPFEDFIVDQDIMMRDRWIERRWFYVSIFLSIFTMPLPDRCLPIFKTEMYLLNDLSRTPEDFLKDDEDVKKTEADEQDGAAGDKNDDDDAKSKAGEGDALVEGEPKKKDDPEKFVRPALFDRFVQCKVVGLVLIFAFWVLAIISSIELGTLSGIEYKEEERKADAWKDFILLTPDQATEFVFVWYLTIFVWGVIINEVRIIIISLLAPIQAQSLFDRQMEIMKMDERTEDDKKAKEDAEYKFQTGKCVKASCSTCCLIPPESVEIALDALFIIDIRLSVERDPKKYAVRDDEKERFDRAIQYQKLNQQSGAGNTTAGGLNGNKPVDIEMGTVKKKGGKPLSTKGSVAGSTKSKGKKGKKSKKGKKKTTE